MKKILHILILALLLSAVLCISATAAEWKDADGRGWLFTVNEDDKTATITGANLKEGEVRTSELNIPSTVEVGETVYTVTKIKGGAFAQGDSFTHSNALSKKYFGRLTLPDTLVEIGANAFAYSAIFGEVEIPASIVSIGDSAFKGCVGLETIIFPETVKSIPASCFYGCKSLTTVVSKGVILNYGNSCFSGCEALLNIDISTETLTIGEYSFNGCLSLSNELVLTKITSIGKEAFKGCSFLNKVTIGDCDFPFNAFTGNSNLKSFTVSENHPTYKTVDGILFSKDGTVLYRYPAGKFQVTYTIPDKITTVETNAFYGAAFLEKVIIGNDVTTVKGSAFAKTGLKTMYFPKNVTSVGERVLEGCPDLVWVIFESSIKLNSNMVSSDSKSYPNLKGVFSKATPKDGSSLPGGAKYGLYAPSLGCIALKEDYVGSHLYGYIDEAADCEKSGNNICCLCGEKQSVEALGHVGEIISTSSLSCTTNNSVTINCINCNLITEIVVEEAPGHTESEIEAVDGALSSYSYTRCTVCGEITIKSFETNVYKSGDINSDGSIDEKDVLLLGKIVGGSASYANLFACDVNADGKVNLLDLLVLKQYVAKLNVSLTPSSSKCTNHTHISTVTIASTSCTEGSAEISFCADCGTVIDEKIVSPKGHIYYFEEITPATCSTKGSSNKKCYSCDLSETVETDTIPHSFSWWMLSDTEFDYQYSYCAVCNVLGCEEVDRGALQQIVDSIPENYTLYCTTESAAELKPIIENAKKALTQEQVDATIEAIREALPRLKYKVQDVPVIYLETEKYLASKTSEYVPAKIVVAFTDENGEIQTISDPGGEMRIRGNYTATGAPYKHPYNIKFSRKINLLGMGMGKKYCLLANAFDPTTIRNALAFEFASDLGLEYTSKYTIVDLYYNGVFKGSYMATTPTDIGEDRIDINEEKDVVIHLSQSNGSEDAAFPSPIFNIQYMRLEQPGEYTAYTRSQMMRIMYQLDFAILSGDTEEMAKYMDLDSMVQYFVFHEIVKDTDVIWDSTRFYIKDGKLHGGPVWDLDISQGNVGKNGGTLHSNYYNWLDEKADGVAEYNYKNSGVTNADIKALIDANLAEYRSTLGTWASIYWAKEYQTRNNSSDAYCMRWWYYYLAEYSNEFMVLVAEFIRDNQDMIKKYYSKELTDKNGNSVSCIIESIALEGDTGKSIARNFREGPYGVTDVAINKSSKSLFDAVEYLRKWWEMRNEWVYEYYTSTYLSEEAPAK